MLLGATLPSRALQTSRLFLARQQFSTCTYLFSLSILQLLRCLRWQSILRLQLSEIVYPSILLSAIQSAMTWKRGQYPVWTTSSACSCNFSLVKNQNLRCNRLGSNVANENKELISLVHQGCGQRLFLVLSLESFNLSEHVFSTRTGIRAWSSIDLSSAIHMSHLLDLAIRGVCAYIADSLIAGRIEKKARRT